MISLGLIVVFVAVVVIAVKNRSEASQPFGPRRRPGAQAARDPLRDKLDEWSAADLIDADQAAAIKRYEADPAVAAPSRLPLAAEAVGYIGGGLIVAAVALTIGSRWEDMGTSLRIAALAVPTLVAAIGGWWTGAQDEPALQRLGSVLWLLAVAGAAAVSAEVWVDALHDGDRPDHGTALFVGAIALAVAGPAWWARRRELQQLAALGATIATLLGILDAVAGARGTSVSGSDVGVALAALGAVWLAGGLFERLQPELLATLSGSVLVLVGTQAIRDGNDHLGLWLGLAAAVALMAIGVSRSQLEVLFAGTAGLFLWTPQIALFYLEDTLGAEVTLLVIGTVLIVLAGLLTRLYPMVRARRPPQARSRRPRRPSRW